MVFIIGILYRITNTNFANNEIKKNVTERKIACETWYIIKGVTLFLDKAAIISQITPAKPAVKYDNAEISLSIG